MSDSPPPSPNIQTSFINRVTRSFSEKQRISLKFNQTKLILSKKYIILGIFESKNQRTQTIIEGSLLKNQADGQPIYKLPLCVSPLPTPNFNIACPASSEIPSQFWIQQNISFNMVLSEESENKHCVTITACLILRSKN